jgi:hypothetical protein
MAAAFRTGYAVQPLAPPVQRFRSVDIRPPAGVLSSGP